MDKRETQINGPKVKEIDDYVQGATLKRWHEHIVSIKKKKDEELSA